EPLFPSSNRTATNLVAHITCGRIRIEPRLLLSCLRSANLGVRLPHRRIRFTCDLLHELECNELPLHALLRPAHARIFRLHRSMLAVLLLGHLHFLGRCVASRRHRARKNECPESRRNSHDVSSLSLVFSRIAALCFFELRFVTVLFLA